jgi:hypothetical protein
MANRTRVITTSSGAFILGSALLGILLWRVPPTFTPGGDVNWVAIALFLTGLLAVVFGLGALVALALHGRWPELAGWRERRSRPDPGIAMRQGALLTLAVAVLAILALRGLLDLAFALVTLVITGLIEAFIQNRRR